MKFQRRGYVLVTSLGLLVLAATLLMSMGRLSMDRAMQAREAQEELQRRWGQITTQRTVLPNVERILITLERRKQAPVAVHRAKIELGGQKFELILGDEQAKTNVNALLDLYDVERSESRLRTAMSGTGLAGEIKLRVGPVPASLPTTRQAILRRYVTGYGQVIDFDDSTAPQKLLAARGNGPAVLELVTLWGDGRLNIRRASGASLALMDSPPLTRIDVERLIEARNNMYDPRPKIGSPAMTPGAAEPVFRLMGEAQLSGDKTNLHLMLGSRCHSLWIIVRDGRREWYSLVVSDQSDPNEPRVETLVW
jgi:hypothetical protein